MEESRFTAKQSNAKSSAAMALDMDSGTDFNPYHNPNEVRKFSIQRNQLLIDEVELGSGNFGCVKKGVLKTDS